jgi:threonine synthase
MAASVTYSSTRGQHKSLSFRDVVMLGLAPDKGLFVPDAIPSVTPTELQQWRTLAFPDLAVAVISKFVQADQVPPDALRSIVHRSCASFRHAQVTPVVSVGGHSILVRAMELQRRNGIYIYMSFRI